MGGFFPDPHPRDIERERNQRDEQLAEAIRDIRFFIGALYRRTERIMATLDEVLQRVYDQRGKIDSLATLIGGIKEKLDEALAGALSPANQAKVDAIFTELDNNTAAIVKAVNANDDDPSNDPVETPSNPPPLEPAPTPPVDETKPPEDDPRLPPVT